MSSDLQWPAKQDWLRTIMEYLDKDNIKVKLKDFQETYDGSSHQKQNDTWIIETSCWGDQGQTVQSSSEHRNHLLRGQVLLERISHRELPIRDSALDKSAQTLYSSPSFLTGWARFQSSGAQSVLCPFSYNAGTEINVTVTARLTSSGRVRLSPPST